LITRHETPEGIIFRSSYSTAEIFFDVDGTWHIAGLWTRKDFRGHGHAAKLMHYIVCEADKADKVMTIALETQDPERMREKCTILGFTTKGSTRHNYMVRQPCRAVAPDVSQKPGSE